MKYIIFILIFITRIACCQQNFRPGNPLSNVLEMNPSFAGGALTPRIQALYRNQWPKIGSNHVANYFASDLNLASFNSGFGVYFSGQNMAQSIFKTAKSALVYNYRVRVSDEWNCRLGLGTYLQTRRINSDNLLFPDQVSPVDGSISSTHEPLLKRSVRNWNFSSGFLLYNSDFWLGMSVSEIAGTRSSFTSSLIPTHYLNFSIHTMRRFVINQSFAYDDIPGQFVDAVLVYDRAGPFQQISVGGNGTHKPVSLGVFYKGFPFAKDKSGSLRSETLAFKFEFKESDLSFFYNFELSLHVENSGGSHQIGIAFNFPEIEAFKGKKKWKKEAKVLF